MGMFKNLMDRIFHAGAVAQAPFDAAKPGIGTESRVEAARRQGVPVAQAVPNAPAAAVKPAAPVASAAVMEMVDVTTILDEMAKKHPEKLNWRQSIVDLMKLVGMDSSLTARRELAADLHYAGDPGDTAAMNLWLHREVMKKLAENGGHVPADLLH